MERDFITYLDRRAEEAARDSKLDELWADVFGPDDPGQIMISVPLVEYTEIVHNCANAEQSARSWRGEFERVSQEQDRRTVRDAWISIIVGVTVLAAFGWLACR